MLPSIGPGIGGGTLTVSTILVPTKAQLAELMPSVIANLAKKLAPEDGIKLAAGKYRVQATALVHVDGYLTKSPDGEFTPTDVPIKAVLAIALKRAGIGPDRIQAFVGEIAAEAMKADKAITKELDEALEKFKEAIAKTLPKQPRKGALKIEGELKVKELEKVAA
jgi:hypothetical protein